MIDYWWRCSWWSHWHHLQGNRWSQMFESSFQKCCWRPVDDLTWGYPTLWRRICWNRGSNSRCLRPWLGWRSRLGSCAQSSAHHRDQWLLDKVIRANSMTLAVLMTMLQVLPPLWTFQRTQPLLWKCPKSCSSTSMVNLTDNCGIDSNQHCHLLQEWLTQRFSSLLAAASM